MPVTVSGTNRKNDSPPRQNVYVSFRPCRLILTGCRWYITLFIMASARSRCVSLYPFRKIDPGRKTDFQSSVSRTLSSASPGLGGLGSLRSEEHTSELQ